MTASMLRLSDAIRTADGYERALDRAAEVVADALHAACMVALLSDADQAMYPLAVHHACGTMGDALDRLVDVPFPAAGGLTGRALADRATLLEAQLTPERLRGVGSAFEAFAREAGPYSLVIAPLDGETGVLGALYVARPAAGEPFSEEEVHYATVGARLIALAVESAFLVEALEHAAGRRAVRPRWRPPDERPDGERRAHSSALSEREREVLAKLALGYTNKEIAEQLVLSVRTVEWHRARIQWKLGVSSRAELVQAADREGLTGDGAR
jgi:DNA-binding CsgD family transcriptional regulator